MYVGREGTFVQEALPVPEIHTTVGAGDNFLAGFAAAILQGAAPEEALTRAAHKLPVKTVIVVKEGV